MMAGIYIHIPFCRRACHYCNFHFSTSLKYKNEFIKALLNEIRLRKNYLKGQSIGSIYFGGGTPSLLSDGELDTIMNTLDRYFDCSSVSEITLEANPDDISSEKLRYWKSSGINRLSIGIQSFFDEDLQWMNRIHSSKQAEACIRKTREAGYENFSIDLIYGGPTLSDEHWMKNIETAILFRVPHISCYALTVEPRTALDKMIRLKKKEPVDMDKQAAQFLMLAEALLPAGYEHYEISNFALPGRRSQHNSSYWKGEHYLGLGPSAHSFNIVSRQWNISNNALYIKALKENILPFESETLGSVEQLNEYIMTSLRTAEGLDLDIVKKKWGMDKAKMLQMLSNSFISGEKMTSTENKLFLTTKGKLFADGIAAELFFEEGQ